MSEEPDEQRRKRLLYQSTHRGTKEADLIIGGFALAHISTLSADQLSNFEALLAESDPDLMSWIGNQIRPPIVHDNNVLKMIKNFKYIE